MSTLKQVVPVSQILFGTDYSYRSSLETTSGLVQGNAFTSAELQLVKRENALRLMPELTLLKGAAGRSQRS
jgi:predicted TIM-barrel fold metal-dependent hydrolase